MMTKCVAIFGVHPIRDCLMRQYAEAGASLVLTDSFKIPSELPDELVVLTGESAVRDADAEAFLGAMAEEFRGRAEKRPLVHLLLQNPATLRRLQVSDFEAVINEVFEVFPFTMEEAWAENVIARLPGIDNRLCPALDRTPVAADSRQFVHLVISGFDSYAESIAVKAAQLAHFPNYDGKVKHPLRTRITIVAPGQSPARDAFISRYHSLFDNSFYRTIDLEKRKSFLHHPQFEGSREDFVDIEWEFVDGTLNHPVMVGKLNSWAKDSGRQLTVVISGSDEAACLDMAIALPDSLLESEVPVWVRMQRDTVSKTLGQTPRYRNIRAFGMDDCGYDVRLPVMQMAKLLNYFYSCSYGSKGTPTSFPADEVEAEWRKAGALKMRLSSVCNVLSMATKMHSLGHDSEDMSTFYALTEEEIQSLSRTEHNRWCVERLLSGTRACTDTERSEIAADISLKKEYKKNRDAHYDLCAYDELQKDENGIDVRTYDNDLVACIPLIVESFLKAAER